MKQDLRWHVHNISIYHYILYEEQEHVYVINIAFHWAIFSNNSVTSIDIYKTPKYLAMHQRLLFGNPLYATQRVGWESRWLHISIVDDLLHAQWLDELIRVDLRLYWVKYLITSPDITTVTDVFYNFMHKSNGNILAYITKSYFQITIVTRGRG